MELGEFLFMLVQQVTDTVRKELETKGVPPSFRPLIMECVSKQIITESYDHLVAIRAREAQEAAAKQSKDKDSSASMKCESHTANVSES